MIRLPSPTLFAHRGAATELPENTLESMALALEVGADALEMDVHLTADGHIVVSHDPTGERMAGVARWIRESTLAAVKTWDVGVGHRPEDGPGAHAGKGYRLPTLDEVLERFPTTPLNIDIKQWQPPMVAQVLAAIERNRASERVILASFRWRTLLAVRRAGYRGTTALSQPEVGVLLALPSMVFRRLPAVGQAVQIPVKAGPVPLATRRLIDKCHDLGMRVDFWTINDPGQAETLLGLGADGIMTDDPRRLAPVIAARRS